MLIIGAKGFAKEVLEIIYRNESVDNLSFYDDVNQDLPKMLYDKFPILTTINMAENYFSTVNSRFILGLGNPIIREKLYEKFHNIGGQFTSCIANNASIGSFNVLIGNGANIMQGVIITNDVQIGKGVLINQLASIGHDAIIEDFVEICPSVSISGNCSIGSKSFIGTNAVILPGIKIGKNVMVGAGSVINKDVPDNCTIVGVPGKIIKTS